MSEYIQINEGEFVHLSSVKRVQTVTAKERESLAKLGNHVQAGRFNTRLDYADGSKSYAPETIDQIAGQGAGFVQVDENAFVPHQNIRKVKTLNQKDRAGFEQRTGRPMRSDFQSQIETCAGNMLSETDGKILMQRIGKPYQPANSPAPQNMAEQRDAVMEKAAPKQKPNGRGRQQSQTPSQ